MTASQRYEEAKQRASKWPAELEKLRATDVAVHNAFSYYMATNDLQSALIMCVKQLAEGNAFLMKEVMRNHSMPPVFIPNTPQEKERG